MNEILILDFFVGFFGNTFNILMIILFVLVGILIGMVYRPKAKNQVMKILPRDKRFIDFDIYRENAISVECEPKKGFPPQRFIKINSGYTGTVGRFMKRMITRFIGKEGTAYTWKTTSKQQKIGSLAKALRGVWGEEFYSQVPEEKRNELENSKVNVTVKLEEGSNPLGFKPVTEENIKQEQDRLAAETWWKGKKLSEKGAFMEKIFIFLAGAGAMAIASKLLGWW